MKTGFLTYNPETDRIGIMKDGVWICEGLHAGDAVELKIAGSWTPARIEADASGNWYFTGLSGVGLTTEARISE